MVDMSPAKSPGLAAKILELYRSGVKSFSSLQTNPQVLMLAKQGKVTEKQIKALLSNNDIDPLDVNLAAAPDQGMCLKFPLSK